jgi:hypothetical protein
MAKVTKLEGLKRKDAPTSQRNDATMQQTAKREFKDQRTTVYLSKDVVRWFKQKALDTGISMSARIEELARAEMAKEK